MKSVKRWEKNGVNKSIITLKDGFTFSDKSMTKLFDNNSDALKALDSVIDLSQEEKPKRGRKPKKQEE